jgi:hypothetical protein
VRAGEAGYARADDGDAHLALRPGQECEARHSGGAG